MITCVRGIRRRVFSAIWNKTIGSGTIMSFDQTVGTYIVYIILNTLKKYLLRRISTRTMTTNTIRHTTPTDTPIYIPIPCVYYNKAYTLADIVKPSSIINSAS